MRWDWDLWDHVVTVLTAVVGVGFFVRRWMGPRLRARKASAELVYRQAVEALTFCDNYHVFVRRNWQHGPSVPNYPLSQPDLLHNDPELRRDVRKIADFYQDFSQKQGNIGHSANAAVALWEQIRVPFLGKLKDRFRARWPISWRRKWSDAEAEARVKAAGPLLEVELAEAANRAELAKRGTRPQDES